MTKPLVSIIIPVYNLENYVAQCIESCLSQTYRNIEVVIVDDGSSDTSLAIVTSLSDKDSRVKVFSQSNAGAAKARETGLANAIGEWIIFVDGDDYIEPVTVESLVDTAYATDSAIVVCNIRYIKSFNSIDLPVVFPPQCTDVEIARYLLEEKLPFSLCAKLFSKSLFQGLVTVKELRIGEDGFWTTQLLLNAAPHITHLNKSLYVYVARENSVIRKPSQAAIDSRVCFVHLIGKLLKERLGERFTALEADYCSFCALQYYGYLLMGGNWKSIATEAIPVFRIFLANKAGVSDDTIQNLAIKAYTINPVIGQCFMKILLASKTMFRFVGSLFRKLWQSR